MFSEITGYYFFSSIIQVEAAIFSIYGLFIVFKIQICKANIDTCKNLLFMKFNKLHMISDFEKKNDSQKEEYITEKAKSAPDEPIAYQFRQWLDNQYSIAKIKSSFRSPLVLLITGMITDAVALIFMQTIQRLFILESILYAISLGIFIVAIIQIYRSITKIILE
ncbi:hypothetical protein HY768_04345 [candidate division TA06 bacterium]|uniref:Uncharacterized protein n=1 Tax=candidate division TA06 bacterium TaxID=2250710 RepID=A0A933IAT7_UNCT6|nr:hypothetical protein [candidate division TA06 bacterium]